MENIIKTKGNKFNFTWIGILLVIYVFILSPLAKHFVLIQSLRNSFVPLALLFLVIFEIIRFYKNKDKVRCFKNQYGRHHRFDWAHIKSRNNTMAGHPNGRRKSIYDR